MRRTTTYPEGSQHAVPGFGGYQSVATALSAEPPHIPVSRQGVYAWYRRRKVNGFPEMHRIAEPTDRLEGMAFDLEEARAWYAQLWVDRAAQKKTESRQRLHKTAPGTSAVLPPAEEAER